MVVVGKNFYHRENLMASVIYDKSTFSDPPGQPVSGCFSTLKFSGHGCLQSVFELQIVS
jgi:hypothetical protein